MPDKTQGSLETNGFHGFREKRFRFETESAGSEESEMACKKSQKVKSCFFPHLRFH